MNLKQRAVGMISPEGEQVRFSKDIELSQQAKRTLRLDDNLLKKLNQKETILSGVESWMNEIEELMRNTLRKVFHDCLIANEQQKNYQNWLFSYPG
jgi:hypothetical protein